MDSFRNEIVSGSKPIVGACSFTNGGRSGCFTQDKGSLPVGQNGINSLEDCASWCNDCPRCGYISFSAALRDCSWFVECRMHTLLTISGGEKFVTLRIRRGEVATLSPPPPPPPWRALKVEAAAAVQLSGHLGPYCALEALEKQVNACRRRFASCDVYVHTWSTLGPRTPHWSTAARNIRNNESSASCVRELRARIGPGLSVRVETQEPPPPPHTLDPLGQRYSVERQGWGAARYFGWQQLVVSMLGAAALQKESGSSYAVAIRLRPDTEMLRDAELDTLWQCIALAALGRLRGFARSLVNCHPDGHFQDGLAVDQCFFGLPATIDSVLGQLRANATEVYRRWQVRWPIESVQTIGPERQLIVAAAMEHVHIVHPCHADRVRGFTDSIDHGGTSTMLSDRSAFKV